MSADDDRHPVEPDIAAACDRLLALLRETCGRELSADGTVWCARRRGHAGECRPLPGGVTI